MQKRRLKSTSGVIWFRSETTEREEFGNSSLDVKSDFCLRYAAPKGLKHANELDL